ncbi:ankyrin repeat-containing domain protein [Trichophaea hybrida]|nr:ankyrin repeat-containing domain protein [Trichophaea hybrida]
MSSRPDNCSEHQSPPQLTTESARSSSTNKTTILVLPNEILDIVYSSLNTYNDRNSLIRSNRFFHTLWNRKLYRLAIDSKLKVKRIVRYRAFQTSLWEYAVTTCKLLILSRLFEYGLDVNVRSSQGNETLLMRAVRSRKLLPEMMALLLDHGIDISAVNQWGSTALHIAVAHDSRESTEMLLQHGAHVNAVTGRGETPLHIALQNLGRYAHDRVGRVELLLKHGADVNAINSLKATALHLAIVLPKNRDLIKSLVEHGANPNTKNIHGDTPIHLAASSAQVSAIKLFLDHGANIEVADNKGRTALDLLIAQGVHEYVAQIFIRGIPVDVVDAQGQTPLHRAVCMNATLTARLLLDYGADINALDGKGLTALRLALESRARDSATLLLERGAAVDAIAPDGTTALHSIAQFPLDLDPLWWITLFLENGANPNTEDAKRKVPLYYARTGAVRRQLLWFGADRPVINERDD